MSRLHILILASLVVVALNTSAQNTADTQNQNSKFPKGERAPASNFTGTVWLKVLVPNDSTFHYQVANVTFEPGARTKWHKHPGGQVLLVTEGSGYYQEKGKPIQILKPGDVIRCPADVEHWHGASPNSGLSHIGIANDHPLGRVIWLQAVTEQEYNSVK